MVGKGWVTAALFIFVSVIRPAPLLAAAQDGQARRLAILRSLDVPHPLCPSPIELGVAAEYFVPVANDLPGVQEYNAAVREYGKKNWSEVQSLLDRFKKIYETSPLLEAVYFLQAEIQIERAGDESEGAIREAEKLLRQALLLYPKSELGPVVSTELANYWLRHSDSQKSLSLYRANRENNPFHPLACVFQMGIAESSNLLGQPQEAEASFHQLLQKCQNERLRTGAELRLQEMAWQTAKDSKSAKLEAETKAKLESIYSNHFAMVPRQYPALLHNLGELEYQAKNYSKAKYYFTEFDNVAGRRPDLSGCVASSSKRLADIGFRTGRPLPEVLGQYLAIRQLAPDTDIGIASEIIGLTLDYPVQSNPEQQRRVLVIDGEVDSIEDEQLRSYSYLQKGLAMLDAGEQAAIPYLMRLDEKTDYKLTKAALGAFVRDRVFAMLEAKGASDKAEGLDEKTAELVPSLVEWLRDSRLNSKASEIYSQWAVAEIGAKLKSGKVDAALNQLEIWKKSGMFPAGGIGNQLKRKLTDQIVRSLFQAKDPVTLAANLMKRHDDLVPLVDKNTPGLWVLLALKAGDEPQISKLLGDHLRAPSSLSQNLPDDVKSYLAMSVGENLFKMKRYAEAEAQLIKVKDPNLLPLATLTRLSMLKEMKRYNQAFELGFSSLNRFSPGDRKQVLSDLFQVASDGKIWNRAPQLLDYSIKVGVTGKELAPFRYLAGRAYFERSHWKQAIQQYQNALLLDPNADVSAESRYRLGKSLVNVRRPTEAVKVWEDLANQKDPFWSPLARNEIKTMK